VPSPRGRARHHGTAPRTGERLSRDRNHPARHLKNFLPDDIVTTMDFSFGPDRETEPAPFLTVSELTSLIKGNLEASFPDVTVEGEISNAKLASSGHFYFSLKDENSIIQAVMFKSRLAGLGFAPADGVRVRAHGAISVYAQRGQYQLIAQSLKKAGTGDILAMLEERKRVLASQGYFDPDRKKPLPRFPERVAVVTSPSGAAIHDILNVLGRRNSCIDVILFPAPVQGPEAAVIIARRIEQANLLGNVDVIIVGRGGGSLEDLLPFSETVVVKAIAASRIPVISAVGHEIDWALSDYAADLRAPTPSAAAELVAESSDALRRETEQFQLTLQSVMESRIERMSAELDVFSPDLVKSRLELLTLPAVNRIDDASEIILNTVNNSLSDLNRRIELGCGILDAASPPAILRRGFSIVRHVWTDGAAGSSAQASTGATTLPATSSVAGPGESAGPGRTGSRVVRAAAELKSGELVQISFAEGSATANVREVEK